VLADDLLRCVALDPPRAGIPAGHVPLRVQHEDRVVRHGVDKQLQPCRVRKVVAFHINQLIFTNGPRFRADFNGTWPGL
jgi:hypothetical protein